jgi:DNA-binding PadR family transcriptional regulator
LDRDRSRYIVDVSLLNLEEAAMGHGHTGWGMPWDDPRAGRHGGAGGGTHGGWGGPPWGGGPPPWLGELLGLAQRRMPRGPKVRRGDVRTAILDVLAVEPMNGYQIIQQIAERSRGAWKPSPGSVYPTVQQLEDEGLVEGRDADGRRLLQLTDAGRRYVEEHPDELAATWRPFEDDTEGEPESHDLKPVIGQVMSAVWQVVVSGTAQQRAEAAEILAETRRRLYGLLAEGDPQ